jgi:peptidyl-prolyl cis-trans isomerase D
MFDFVRNHTRLALGFMLLLIIPSFVFFGVDGYSSFRDGGSASVAKVDGVSITRGEWENAHQRVIDRTRRQDLSQDARSLDTPELRAQTLDALVRERVVSTAARSMQLSPTDARLQRLFVSDPQYAGIRNPDGSVNAELLAMQGLNSKLFAQQLRQDFAAQQVLAGVARTSVGPASVVAAALDPLLQRREVQAQRFDPTTYRDKVSPTEAEIETFYKSKTSQFKAQEQADIQYVMLDLEAMSKGQAVTEEAVKKFYDANAARFGTPEERRASHVLIKAEKGASAADKAKAKARAEELLAQARKNPAGFADLARKNSEDAGTAAQGGDLDFFGRGAMVPPFETAVFGLKAGQISDVFETDFGFHFALLTGERGGQKRALAEVRSEIEAELRKTQAKTEWAKQAELFTNTVYEQSDSLQPAIDKFKLSKLTATVQRQPAPGASGPLASAKLLEAVFGKEAVANKRNTDAVEVGPNQLVSARVVKHSPARILALAEVKERVREELVAEKTAELARAEGLARVASLKQAPNESLANTTVLSRVQTQGAPKALIDAVMQADASKLPVVVGVDLQAQGYVVLKVVKVLPRETPPGGEDTMRAQFAQAWAAAESEAYLAALKKRFKANVVEGASMGAGAASAPAR